jgi:hypothetical protein
MTEGSSQARMLRNLGLESPKILLQQVYLGKGAFGDPYIPQMSSIISRRVSLQTAALNGATQLSYYPPFGAILYGFSVAGQREAIFMCLGIPRGHGNSYETPRKAHACSQPDFDNLDASHIALIVI